MLVVCLTLSIKILTLLKLCFWEVKQNTHGNTYGKPRHQIHITTQIFKILMTGPHSRSAKSEFQGLEPRYKAFFESPHYWEPLIYMKTVFPNCQSSPWKETCIFIIIFTVNLILKKRKQMKYPYYQRKVNNTV